MSEPNRYDMIIVGGGMVGASLAIALSGRGRELWPPGLRTVSSQVA